ncbi:MAG TPA: hypothetical protein VM143_09790 [Acidimicrobiales bacterium]|nr:hypothetical protein [Acidimicrobiales bacterium]
MRRRSRGVAAPLALALALVAAGCSSNGGGGRAAAPGRTSAPTESTSTSSTSPSAGPAGTTTTVAQATPRVTGPAQVRPGPAQAPAASCPAVPERPTPRSDRPTYDLDVDVRPAEGIVVGNETVRFTPDVATDRLVFRLWANAPRITRAGGRIEVGLDGASQPNPTTLVLPRKVAAGETTEVSMTWQLTLPTSGTNDRIARSGNAVRLGSFFPVLSWHPGLGWATEPPTSGFAEASLSLPADFDVQVQVPDGSQVLATGVSDKPGHWVASGVPDWAMSIGDLRIVTGTADGGVAVAVGVDRQVGDAPGPYLDKVIAVLDDFSKRFGPYPWPSYSLVLEPDLSGGIEYPMHAMQGPGTLGRTTSHEVAHMWFYGLVATNQGATPWIDEGLATWAEGRFEGTTASIKAKEVPAAGKGHAGEPMTYWEARQSIYYRSVYVQGAQAVGALGSPELVDCALRQLVARQAYRVSGNGEVIAALSVVSPDAAAVLARYGIHG